MMIRSYQGKSPKIAPSAYSDETAVMIGDVTIGEDSSLWPMVVARGVIYSIVIGKRTIIQDGVILHGTHDGHSSPGGHPRYIVSGVDGRSPGHFARAYGRGSLPDRHSRHRDGWRRVGVKRHARCRQPRSGR